MEEEVEGEEARRVLSYPVTVTFQPHVQVCVDASICREQRWRHVTTSGSDQAVD